jgi:hypothetical protein
VAADGISLRHRLAGPAEISAAHGCLGAAPFQVALAAISWAVGPEATGKILVFAILAGGALSAYRAVPTAFIAGRVAGATLFIVNPFVFGRLHHGQLFLLAGYALLPWLALGTSATNANDQFTYHQVPA